MLPDANEFQQIVSGRARGLRAAAWRLGFRIAEGPYTLAVRWRNRRYDLGRAEIRRVGVPVVSVGNITLGGTGKTPMVEWIARFYRGRGVRVAVVSRGFGAEKGALNDEGRELEERLPDVPHVQSPDRVAAAELAIEEFATELIVLDDAFQHRRLARDLDVVMLDAQVPFGYGHVFPRGMLREPAEGLRRAHVVVLSRADMAEPAQRQQIRCQVARLAPQTLWAETFHAPRALVDCHGRREPAEWLAGRRVAAFCGIGNPAAFRHTLERLGCQVVALKIFADHYAYARTDVEQLNAWAAALCTEAVLCTHKDLVKLGIEMLGGSPLRAVVVELEFLAGQAELEQRLAELCPGRPGSTLMPSGGTP